MKKKYVISGVLALVLLVTYVITRGLIDHTEATNQQRASLPSVATHSLATPSVTAPTTTAVQPAQPTPTSSSPQSMAVSPSAESPSSTSAPAPEPVAIQPLAPAVPTALHIHEPGVDLDAIIATMAYTQDLTPIACVDTDDPNCPNTAYFVADTLGMAPGYPNFSSTYIIGHAWSEGPRVFNRLSELVLQGADLTGYKITLDTPNGSITYEIYKVEQSRKKEISQAEEIWERSEWKPDRLVLMMCAMDRDFNFAVMARVVATQPR